MRRPWLVLVVVMVAACSTGGATTPVPSGTPVSSSAPPASVQATQVPIAVTGDPATGVSASFVLTPQSGFYDVAWTTTADTPGCDFNLVLAKASDGTSVTRLVKQLTDAKEYSGSDIWFQVFPGTYVLKEDRSGFGACKGPWSATLTPR
jgi:hypothetical protein